VLVGTKKGAFVLTSDGKRERWDVCGPHFGGWEIYHLKGSPIDPDRLYASQSGGWFGQVIQRSSDGGKTWEPVGNKFVYDGVAGTHQWYDGTPHPWEFKRVWHLEPSLTDPDTVYAGVEDAALFRSTDGGQSFQRVLFKDVNTGGNDVDIDPANPNTVYATLWEERQGPWENAQWRGTGGGIYKSTDGGSTWKPLTNGLPQNGALTQANLAIAPSNAKRVYAAVAVNAATSASLDATDARCSTTSSLGIACLAQLTMAAPMPPVMTASNVPSSCG